MKNYTLLVTKKLSPSLVLQAGIKGLSVLEKEFIRIVPLSGDQLNKKISRLAGEKITVAFTSKNAVAAVAANGRLEDIQWKIFCIEGATKKDVKKYFDEKHIAGTAKNAALLAEEIVKDNSINKIIFFCGNRRLEDLPALLKEKNIEVEETVVYHTELVHQKIIDDFDAIAFFSPSAVESFFKDNTLKKNAVCISVGKTTSEAIKKYSQNQVITSENPSEESVIELAIKHSKH